MVNPTSAPAPIPANQNTPLPAAIEANRHVRDTRSHANLRSDTICASMRLERARRTLKLCRDALSAADHRGSATLYALGNIEGAMLLLEEAHGFLERKQ